MAGLRVAEVDPHDEGVLRAFWECEQAAMLADRPHALLRTWDRLRTMLQTPNEWYARSLLVALDGDRVVGGADLGRGLRDNTHLADLEITVVPGERRRGVGRALYDDAIARLVADGRTSVCGEVYVPPGADGPGAAAYDFARTLGFGSVHVEDHLLLDLPMAPAAADALRDRVDAVGYDVLTWRGACPDEHVDAFCAMRTRMNNDVPIGEVDLAPVVVTVERLRAGEARTLRSFDGVTAVARRAVDGEFGGYTQVWMPHGQDHVQQDDTLVMPDHRGHRLGTLLKLATLEVVQREHPERVAIHTWTAVDNHAMQATNRSFGFRAVERMHEMQRKDG